MRSQRLFAAIAVPIALLISAAHAAQPAFPERPIRLILGAASGSGPDIVARVLAERLSKTWGQRMVVDPRPGVAGILSAELALRANPDGYTWLMVTSSLFVATSVYSDLKFNLDKDFVSISLIGTVPFVLMSSPKLPATSISELIALAKKSPGTLRYGTAGTGGGEHLAGVKFSLLTGANVLHVPYKGVAEAIAGTLAGDVHFTYAVLPVALPHVQTGRLRALGVSTPKRAALIPDVPAISEAVSGYATFGWYSLMAPIGTPPAVLAKASAEVVKAVKEPEFGEQIKALGIDIIAGGRPELDSFRREERKRLNELVKAGGVAMKL